MAVAWAVPLSSRQLEVTCRERVGPLVAAGSEVALARSADGAIGLAWMEGGGVAEAGRLLFSSWDRVREGWCDPVSVPESAWRAPRAAGMGPVLAMGAAGCVAVALPQDGGWRVWLSPDGGHTWSVPFLLAEGGSTLALAVLSDGRTLAVWRSRGGKLLSRVVGTEEPPMPVGHELADPLPFSLVALLDGSAVLATWVSPESGVGGLAVRGFDGEAWRAPAWISKDCRRGAPERPWVAVAADGPQMGAFWSDGGPAMLSWSSDGGQVWTLAQRCGGVAGDGAIARMRDGSVYVVWRDETEVVLLRRYNALGGAMLPAELGVLGGGGRVQLVVEREDSVQGAGALLLVSVGDSERVVSQRVSLPSAAVLAEMDGDCECLEGRVVSHGYPVKGRVMEVAGGVPPYVRIWQPGVFGLMREGGLRVRVAPRTAERLASGQEFLARLELRAGEWWLFDVRLLRAR